MEIAGRHALFVLEDACQAHGAQYKGRTAGSIGHAAAFSFYPGKNLGAVGEAGAVTTNDRALADLIKCLRDHGQAKKYHHSHIGWNARMDGIQGAALQIKLRRLEGGNAARRNHAGLYDSLLGDVGGVAVPYVSPDGVPVYHLYVVRVAERDRLLAALAERGIACGIHYPRPIHLQAAYAGLGLGPGSFPVSERVADELLSLPMFPELTAGQVELVARELTGLVAPLQSAALGTARSTFV